jgi:hypothetical protein
METDVAHFAKINETNIVTQIVVVNNNDVGNLEFPASEPLGQNFLAIFYGDKSVWRQTSYSGAFRKNFAGIGYFYDEKRDSFIAPQPYPSWLLNAETCRWQSPVPYPEDGNLYIWDEATQSWVVQNV